MPAKQRGGQLGAAAEGAALSSLTSGLGAGTAGLVSTAVGDAGGVSGALQGGKSFWQSYGTFIIVAVVVISIGAGIYYIVNRSRKGEVTANVGDTLNPGAAAATSTSPSPPGTEGFQVAPQPSNVSQAKLVDTQPLAIKHAGAYTTGENGQTKFDAVQATQNALKAGFRTFVLQIDYIDAQKDLSKFGEPRDPILILRDSTGALRSENSESIEKVAEAIASMAFSSTYPNSTAPVLLYIHVLRAPSPLRQPDDYLNFMSKIAAGLKPLAPFHLGLTPLGDFHRQKMESELLKVPLSFLQGQVVILSNADTSLFQNKTLNRQRFNPIDDLDYWVNMRVYLGMDEGGLGITQMPEKGTSPAAVVYTMVNALGQSETTVGTYNKTRFSIAMPTPTANPTQAQLTSLLGRGFNLVPINIFGDTIPVIQALSAKYSNRSWNEKPVALQYPERG